MVAAHYEQQQFEEVEENEIKLYKICFFVWKITFLIHYSLLPTQLDTTRINLIV